MKSKYALAIASAALVLPATTHEIAGPHIHPHGDATGTVALLVAVAGLCVWLLRGSFRQ